MKTIAEKLGLKPGQRIIFIDKPDTVLLEDSLTEMEIATVLQGMFDYIHLFVTKEKTLEQKLPVLKKHLQPTGSLWVSWPKNRQNDTDLTIQSVIKTAYDLGFVESKTISIDDTWSAIKLTHPKTGQKYRNSYGQLKKKY